MISSESLKQLSADHKEILDKLIAVLAVKDPIAFQQVQAMSAITELSDPVDLSPEADTDAWLAGQELTEFERGMIRESGY